MRFLLALFVLGCPFSGDDPGLAFDRLRPPTDAGGPYTLEFRLQSRASGSGEVYWTTDPRTKLPQGQRIEFAVTHDGTWQDVRLEIDEKGPIHALRLDPCSGPGEVRIERLRLTDARGHSLYAQQSQP
jgi:hypothetical protein